MKKNGKNFDVCSNELSNFAVAKSFACPYYPNLCGVADYRISLEGEGQDSERMVAIQSRKFRDGETCYYAVRAGQAMIDNQGELDYQIDINVTEAREV